MAVNQAGASAAPWASTSVVAPSAIHIRGIAPLRDLAVDGDQHNPVGYGLFILPVRIIPMLRITSFCRGSDHEIAFQAAFQFHLNANRKN